MTMRVVATSVQATSEEPAPARMCCMIDHQTNMRMIKLRSMFEMRMGKRLSLAFVIREALKQLAAIHNIP